MSDRQYEENLDTIRDQWTEYLSGADCRDDILLQPHMRYYRFECWRRNQGYRPMVRMRDWRRMVQGEP